MPELSTEDYEVLARLLDMQSAKLRATFERQQVATFRVKELKVVARFMKGTPKFAHFQFRLNGRKEELASDISLALTTPTQHSFFQNLPSVGVATPTATSPSPFQAPRWPAPAPSYLARPQQPPPTIVKSVTSSPYYLQSQPPSSASSSSPSYVPVIQTLHSRINDITQSNAFRIGRSPFCVLQSVLAAGFGLAREATKLKFTLPPTNPLLLVHVRLFDTVAQAHIDFGAKSRVFVNGGWVMIPEPKKLSYAKKKGLRVIGPLVVTERAKFGGENVAEVNIDPSSTTHELTKCLICVELVSKQSVEQVVSNIRTLKRSSDPGTIVSAPEPPVAPPKCGLCGSLANLQRCSRCKAQWYCGSDHQGRHWMEHRKVCMPPAETPGVKVENVAPAVGLKREHVDDDDELQAVENSVSLMCPLSLSRIKVPARGESCTHRRCFDLDTWLVFSDPTDIWQCPLCSAPLHPSQVVIDAEMKTVLQQMDPDIEAIRFKDDGTFEAVNEEKGPPRKKQSNNRPAPAPTSIVSLSDESDDDNAPLVNNRSDSSPSTQPGPQKPVVVPRSASSPPVPAVDHWTNGTRFEPLTTPPPPPPRHLNRNDDQFIWNVNPSGATVDEAILIDSDED